MDIHQLKKPIGIYMLFTLFSTYFFYYFAALEL